MHEVAEKLVSRAEAARRLHVSDGTIDRLRAAGELETVRTSRRRVMIRADSVESYLTRLNPKR